MDTSHLKILFVTTIFVSRTIIFLLDSTVIEKQSFTWCIFHQLMWIQSATTGTFFNISKHWAGGGPTIQLKAAKLKLNTKMWRTEMMPEVWCYFFVQLEKTEKKIEKTSSFEQQLSQKRATAKNLLHYNVFRGLFYWKFYWKYLNVPSLDLIHLKSKGIFVQ